MRLYQKVLSAVLVVGAGIGAYVVWRRRKVRIDSLNRDMKRRKKRRGNVNIGAVFGMDVGGSLAKIVYLAKHDDAGGGSGSNSRSNSSNSSSSSRSGSSSSGSSSSSSSGSSGGGYTSEPRSEGAPGKLLRRNNSQGSLAQLDTPESKAALQDLSAYMDETLANATPRPGGGGGSHILMHDDNLSFHSPLLGGQLYFLNFETRNMISAINMLSHQSAFTENIKTIGCTGGGAHKYAADVEEQLDIHFEQKDELECLVSGMHFALTYIDQECYTYRSANVDQSNQKEMKEYTQRVQMPYNSLSSTSPFPYLIVNIGSGVSILKISAPGKYERVSGSSVGGGTYWGLCRLLVPSKETYEEVLDLADKGDPSAVDMLVKDIYGGGYDAMNLSGAMVASSFGKLVMKEYPRDGMKEEDLAIALLMMITNNIGQVSYLNAQLHGCSKIFFVGSFLRHNNISCRRLAFAIDFWSKGAMEALFLVHEGYFGALGTFLKVS